MEFTANIHFNCNQREDAEMIFALMREAFCNWEIDRGVKEVSANLICFDGMNETACAGKTADMKEMAVKLNVPLTEI